MHRASIYKDLKGYILFPVVKSKSGFWISTDPKIRIYNAEKEHIVSKLRNLLNIEGNIVLTSFISKEEAKERWQKLKFLGIKNWEDLNKPPFTYCSVKLIDEKMILTPSIRDPVLKKGYIEQDSMSIEISYKATDEEIFNCIETTLNGKYDAEDAPK